ncbi:MAG: hypothetical protein KKB79_00275 [Nanoarchaeota archaeon]|nr:hypothetical protein [Nanoarchaeota archaeon]
MHSYNTSENLDKILSKLFKKDKQLYEQIFGKIREIVNSESIESYKNLKYNMKDSKRVHIGHFVLVFSYDKKSDFVSFETFKHHDDIYKR